MSSIANSANLASGQYYSDLHRAAVEIAESGLPVFPCIEGGKEPITPKGFKNRTTDRTIIDAWWQAHPLANVAIVPEDDGYAVVDIEADGLAQLSQFCEGRELPRTFTNRTPRGGQHRFYAGSVQSLVRPFKRPDGSKFEIDTRGRGGYVLMPPSRTADGEYETSDDCDVAAFPQWIAAKLAERKYDHQAAADNLEFDLKENVRRGRNWLAGQTVPVQGERNDKTYKAACTLKDLGIGAQTVLDMLLPWQAEDFTPEEIERTVISAFENGQNAPGCDAVTSSAEAFAHLKIAAANANTSPVSFSDVLKREVQPVAEIIPGLIEKGVATMLAGPGGVHKSRTAVHWGLAISAGLPVYGRQTERARFVFLSYEDHPDEVARRSQAMTHRLKCDWGDNAEYWDLTRSAEGLAIVSEDGIKTTPFYDHFRAHLLSIVGHKFVVLDSTYNVLAFLGQAKISEPAVKGAIELLNQLCRETDSTIVFLWHPSQAGQERGDASGWSVAWQNTPRARVSLKRLEKGKDAFELCVEKRNNAAIGQPLTLHWDNGLLLPISAVGTDEQAARFTEACVKVALDAASNGAPITKQRHLHDWQIKEIDYAIGKRPTDREVKAELARAQHLRILRYVIGHGRQQAGYYPFNVDKGPFLSDETILPEDTSNNSEDN